MSQDPIATLQDRDKADETERAGRMSRQHHPNQATDEGIATQDLGARYAASAPVAGRRRPWYETAGAEEHIRTRGRLLIFAGLSFSILTFVLAVVWEQGFGNEMPVGYLLPLYAIAFGSVAIGGLEYLHRPTRYSVDLCLYRNKQLERQVSALVELLNEQLQQKYYEGMAEGAKVGPIQLTGTEDARPLGKYQGEILNFRRR